MDQLGNILVKTQGNLVNNMTMSYDAASCLVTLTNGSAVTSYTYDNNGNMTIESANGNLTRYAYDRENRLTQFINGVDINTYTYSADGLRRSKWELIAGVYQLSTMIWDGQDYLGEVN